MTAKEQEERKKGKRSMHSKAVPPQAAGETSVHCTADSEQSQSSSASGTEPGEGPQSRAGGGGRRKEMEEKPQNPPALNISTLKLCK